MMLMADGSFNFWSGTDSVSGGGDIGSVVVGGGGEFAISDEDFNLSIDLDSFYSILGEDNDPQQLGPEDSSFQNVLQGDSASITGNHENFLLTKGLQEFEGAPQFGAHLPGTHNISLSCNIGASDFRTWGPEIFFESGGNFDYGQLDLSAQIGPPLKMLHSETQNKIPDCSNALGFVAGVVNHVPDCPDNADLSYVRGNVDSKYTPYSPLVEDIEINRGHYGIPSENIMETLGAPEDNSSTSMEISSNNATHNEANICQVSDNICSDFQPAMQYPMSMDDTPFAELSDSLTLQFIPRNESKIKDENACFNSRMISKDQFGRSARHEIDFYNLKSIKYEDGNNRSPFNGNCFSKGSVEPSTQTQSITSSQKHVKEEGSNESITPQSSTEVMGKAVISKIFPGADDRFFTNKDLKQSFPGHQPRISSMNHMVHAKDEKEGILFPSKRAFHSDVIIEETSIRNPVDGECMVVKKYPSMKQQLGHIMNEKECKPIQPKSMGSHFTKFRTESTQSSFSGKRIHVDDDTDICILEDISMPPRSNPSPVQLKSLVSSQRSPLYEPLYHVGDGAPRMKANDERDIFRVALQDLSQPKSEASPPEGLLAVPLLRHQKIALSWMVQKETASLFCSGGILADDQGLGKTISTIALILKERSPSSKAFQMCMEQGELETLNLEDDDDLEFGGTKGRDASVQSMGRPAAGTLVVCPTSVLRQWAEELHNKVTGKANLSVLVYHGSNRTKDPCELAKYDVVLTTYAIVSMEVPKQPLVDKDDDEKKKAEARVVQSMGFGSSRKRKYPPSSCKRGSKDKKGMDNALIEAAARPLAKVGWFRVVLDEAQSIKNHRTQVARACWGLRAKRRWCLSGTPIQNAIDDLYSYFRFLRYDPYAVYKSFCSTIKVPINRNPTNGYRKLQAVLKTIMLRRTKGTLLDGEPIINLPPKSIELKRVDFSEEERDFYSRLEADSRAQFKEYAAAGTVKQNYVNILLMLLRLRQACDHPLLVRGRNSKSTWRSSVEMAKKLPQDKRNCLLTCLEASLAICGICNDPPEDAVVSICGHVFCNQCICEHLTGDDNQCPSTNCKGQLSASSVFSKATLKSSLDAQSVQGYSPGSSGCELVEALEPSSEEIPFDSSKIKAALKVLQSLSKPQNGTAGSGSLRSLDETSCSPEAPSDPQSWGVHKDIPDKGNVVVDMNKDLNGSIKVVGEKAIVFSQWTRMLDLLEACLKDSSIQYRRLDGTMSVLARDKAVKDFNTLPEVSVMIMSLKAASLGLNMVAACHVVLLDLWWNPTTEDQAIDRAHRIGQTRPVTVLRLTVKDTVEDRILALQQKKREMVASAFGEDETGSRQTRLTVEDLKYLFMV